MRMVLGGAAKHRRPPDVDVFNRFLQPEVRFGDGLLEGIKVDHDQINGTDALLFDGRLVRRIAPQKKQAAVHFRVQGLEAAVEHFGVSGVITQFNDRQARLAQDPGGAARGDEFHFRPREHLRERSRP